ncbi:aminotransferase class V-fold PLP-dependent enzyme, partial [Pseudomonas sp.]
GAAYALASAHLEQETQSIGALSARLRDGLLQLSGVRLNGCAQQRIPHTLNVCIDVPGFNSATLANELALSSTSACNSASAGPSHVLVALGLSAEQAQRSVRLSLGRYTTQADVDRAIDVIGQALSAPPALW